jgi:hypothetical protein
MALPNAGPMGSRTSPRVNMHPPRCTRIWTLPGQDDGPGGNGRTLCLQCCEGRLADLHILIRCAAADTDPADHDIAICDREPTGE